MRDEIRKHQKGRESKEGQDCGRQTILSLRGGVEGKVLFFSFFFFIPPLVCVTDNSRPQQL